MIPRTQNDFCTPLFRTFFLDSKIRISEIWNLNSEITITSGFFWFQIFRFQKKVKKFLNQKWSSGSKTTFAPHFLKSEIWNLNSEITITSGFFWFQIFRFQKKVKKFLNQKWSPGPKTNFAPHFFGHHFFRVGAVAGGGGWGDEKSEKVPKPKMIPRTQNEFCTPLFRTSFFSGGGGCGWGRLGWRKKWKSS